MAFRSMRRALRALVVFGLGATSLIPSALGGATGAAVSPPIVYVSASGRDSNACTQSRPCASFSRAYQVARAGATVKVAAGSYPEQVVTYAASKGAEPVVFEGEPGVVISGDLAAGPPSSACVGARNVTFRGMQATWLVTRCGARNVVFERMRAGSINFNAGPVVLRGSDIGGMFVNAVGHIKQQAQGALIENTTFHDFVINNPDTHSECLMIWQGARDITIRGSVFRNCTDFGVFVKPGYNILIENSFFDAPMPGWSATADCSPNCPRAGAAVAFSEGSGFTVRYSSLLGEIRVDPEVSNVTLRGNVAPRGSCQSNTTFSFNVWSEVKCSATDRTAPLDAVFERASSPGFDLRLKAGSKALGAGDALDHPIRDIAGRLRPDGFAPDAGAWQRESALISPGRAVGTAKIGMRRDDVRAFYLQPRARGKVALPTGTPLEYERYRVRAGTLTVSYRNDVAVMITTTSPFYRAENGLATGKPMRARANDDGTCRPIGGRVGKSRLYLRPTRSKPPRVAEVVVVGARLTPPCAVPPGSR